MPTPIETYTNSFQTSLTSGITATATTIPVLATAGTPTTGQFRIVIDQEIIICPASGVTANSFTSVTRGQEQTTAATHSNSTAVNCYLTRDALLALVVKHPYKMRAHATTSTAFAASTFQLVNLNVIDFDLNGNFSNASSGNTYTAPVTGYYQVTANIYMPNGAMGYCVLYKNSTEYTRASASSNDTNANLSDVIALNANDTISLYGYNGSASTITPGMTNQNYHRLAIHLLSM